MDDTDLHDGERDARPHPGASDAARPAPGAHPVPRSLRLPTPAPAWQIRLGWVLFALSLVPCLILVGLTLWLLPWFGGPALVALLVVLPAVGGLIYAQVVRLRRGRPALLLSAGVIVVGIVAFLLLPALMRAINA